MHAEKTLRSVVAYQGRLLRVEEITVELGPGVEARREVVRHPGAVAVLGALPGDQFVLVRQFRKAVDRALLEVVAGTLSPGEEPHACAVREMKEETGYDTLHLRPLGAYQFSPGFSDERIHMFFAALNPVRGAPSPDDDERTEAVCLRSAEIDEMLASGRIEDAKTALIWLLYQRSMRR